MSEMWLKPHSGEKQQCQICGKHQYPSIHSCRGRLPPPTTEEPVMLLSDAQRWLADRIKTGARCPCCNQYAKVYRRQINSGMARSLIAMYLHGPQGQWVHLPTQVGARSREEGKLRYWDLVEEQVAAQRDDGGRVGYWRLTDAGRSWVTGQTTVPKYVTVYANKVLESYGEQISISDALGSRFNYSELMTPQPMGTP